MQKSTRLGGILTHPLNRLPGVPGGWVGDKGRPEGDIVLSGVNLGQVVGKVVSTRCPGELELLLGDAIFYPEEA